MVQAQVNNITNTFYMPHNSPLKLRLLLEYLILFILRALKISPTQFTSNNQAATGTRSVRIADVYRLMFVC